VSGAAQFSPLPLTIWTLELAPVRVSLCALMHGGFRSPLGRLFGRRLSICLYRPRFCGCFSVLEPGAVAFPLISAAMRVPTPPLVLSIAACAVALFVARALEFMGVADI